MIGPGFFNLNAALAKTTQFGERVGHAASAGDGEYNQHPAVRQSEHHLLHREQRELRIRDRHARQRLRLGQRSAPAALAAVQLAA